MVALDVALLVVLVTFAVSFALGRASARWSAAPNRPPAPELPIDDPDRAPADDTATHELTKERAVPDVVAVGGRDRAGENVGDAEHHPDRR